MSTNKKLPKGWFINTDYCWDQGTGMGDDRYGVAIFHWEEVTHGFFRKIKRFQWVLYRVWPFGRAADNQKLAIEWANIMEDVWESSGCTTESRSSST